MKNKPSKTVIVNTSANLTHKPIQLSKDLESLTIEADGDRIILTRPKGQLK